MSVEDKDIYIFDGFFLSQDGDNLRKASIDSGFSRDIYADHESQEQGEEPSRAMSNKEKWMFFSHPPLAVTDLFRFFCHLAEQLDVEISTLPWELCDENICAPAFATN
jgi:hypothetical protein